MDYIYYLTPFLFTLLPEVNELHTCWQKLSMDVLVLHLGTYSYVTSKPASYKENTVYLQNLLVIGNPLVLKFLKLAMELQSYEKFSTGKVNANGLD